MRPGMRHVERQLQVRSLEARNALLAEQRPDRPLGSADAGRGLVTPDRGAGAAAHLAYLRGVGPKPATGGRRHWTDVL
jgi:hypothetical protein